MRLRIFGLIVTLGLTLFAIGKLVLEPPREKQQPIAFPVPPISLSGWDYWDSRYLQDAAGKIYKYGEGDRLLKIEIRQINHTDGHVENYLKNYKNIDPLLTIKQESGIGFYGLFVEGGNAYLSSCINPRGESTVTADRFIRNRNTYDLQWNRILSWLLGRSDLREWRCLWVNLSMPLDGADREDIYTILEKIWFEWYRWWNGLEKWAGEIKTDTPNAHFSISYVLNCYRRSPFREAKQNIMFQATRKITIGHSEGNIWIDS